MYEDQVRQILEYNPEDGLFRYKRRSKNRYGVVMPGDVAGTKIAHGYMQISVCGKAVRSHRLAFLFMEGAMPPDDIIIDHINGDKTDNRWANLRRATHSQNQMNAIHKGAASGRKGVYWFARQNKWRAYISANKKNYFLGGFANKQDAVDAREKAEMRLHAGWIPVRV